ncbi:MAG: DNA-3-methyladenine glycosylase [Candidatus Kapaibacterium sp.]
MSEISGKIPGKDFYLRDTSEVARDLIGKVLSRRTRDGLISGRIVETEAYLQEGDTASHSYPGLTKRNAPMFEEGGTLYIYKIYGIHLCANIVTGKKGSGSAVLIRACEPLEGISRMKINRGTANERILMKGPGNCAKAFGFSLNDNFKKLFSDEIFILDDGYSAYGIIESPRIGISKSAELNLRYFMKASPFVSGKKFSIRN